MSDVPHIPGPDDADPLDTDSAGEFVAPVRVFVPIDPDDPGGWARECQEAEDIRMHLSKAAALAVLARWPASMFRREADLLLAQFRRKDSCA